MYTNWTLFCRRAVFQGSRIPATKVKFDNQMGRNTWALSVLGRYSQGGMDYMVPISAGKVFSGWLHP